MAAQTVVILGGGVGGIVTANLLRRRLDPSHRIVLVDKHAEFVFAPSLLWVMTGLRKPGQITRDLRALAAEGVEVLRGAVTEIDVAQAWVQVGGQRQPYDHLVIALGADLAPDALPGYAETAHNFYTLDGATRLWQELQRRQAGRIARAHGIVFHTDAAQSVDKVATRVNDLNVDLLTVAGHKLYAPKGIGALYVRRGVQLEPVIHGASQEQGRRAGTENVASIVALGEAAELAGRVLSEEEARLRSVRDRFHQALAERIPGLHLNGHPTQRLPNTLNVSFPGTTGIDLLASLPELAASTGAACHSGSTEPSAVLLTMGIPRDPALGAVRFSLGRWTMTEQVDQAAALLVEQLARAGLGHEPV